MRPRFSVLIPLISMLVCLSVFSQAQLWSGIVDPARAVNWSQAGAGTIPNRSTVCATLNPGATAAQINSAIASCPSGQVVFLNAGTYSLAAGIDFNNKSNVTLRGAGADQTKLVFSNGISCSGLSADVCVRNGDVNYAGGPTHTANWTAGYANGTTQITLSSTTSLAVGSVLVLDQLNDSSDPGTVWICSATGVCSNGGPGGGGRPNRDQQQLVTVTAISGSTVTISPGLYMPNWRSSQSPGAWWATSSVSGDGVENLSIDSTNSTGDNAIVVFNGKGCWVKGVRSITPGRNHVWLYVTAHSTVRDSYFFGSQNAASESYGVESFGSSDNLVENNIFQQITAPLMMSGSASGSVFAHNFAINDLYFNAAWMQPSDYLHAVTDNMLFEGNQGSGLIGDNVHGTHHFTTAFRNYYTGWESGKTAQTVPVQLYLGSRYFNVIGNVLGKSGYHNSYQDVVPAGSNGNTSIFTLGWSGNGGGTDSCCPNDPLTAASLMRWGNYDVVNNATRFVAAEVPTGLSLFANALPSSQTLPPSFYAASKPSWWGTMPWPAIGPDVTGGSDGGGHVYANPAHACYSSVMAGPADGSGGVRTFSAGSCYAGGGGGGTGPAPPQGLTAVVH